MEEVTRNTTKYILSYKGKNYTVLVNHKLDKNNKPVMQITPNAIEFKKWKSIRQVVWQHHQCFSPSLN